MTRIYRQVSGVILWLSSKVSTEAGTAISFVQVAGVARQVDR